MAAADTFNALRTPHRDQWSCYNCIHDETVDGRFHHCKLYLKDLCNSPTDYDDTAGARYVYNGKDIVEG